MAYFPLKPLTAFVNIKLVSGTVWNKALYNIKRGEGCQERKYT